MFENVVAIKINILIVWSWPTMKIVDWQLFKAHKWVTASAAEQPDPAWRAQARRGGGRCRANSWRPVMWTLKIFDSIWPQEGPCHQATFLLSSTDYFLCLEPNLNIGVTGWREPDKVELLSEESPESKLIIQMSQKILLQTLIFERLPILHQWE